MKKFILLILIFLFTLNSKATPPSLLITYPSKAFLKSYFFLKNSNLIPSCRLHFLIHKSQKSIYKSAESFLKKMKFSAYKFHFLKNFPVDKEFEKSKFNLMLVNPEIKRYSVKSSAIIPSQWKRVFENLLKITDGCIIPGGADIPAAAYNTNQFIEARPQTPLRSTYELAFLRTLLTGEQPLIQTKPRYLVLGICLGAQSINVACGGTMYQSIPLEVYNTSTINEILKLDRNLIHKNYYLYKYFPCKKVYTGWFHKIKFIAKSKFFNSNPTIFVLSNHHQAVKKPGKNLKIIATSIDGKIAEIWKHKVYPNVIGVQFHPERKFTFTHAYQLNPQTLKFHRDFWGKISLTLLKNAQLNRYR